MPHHTIIFKYRSYMREVDGKEIFIIRLLTMTKNKIAPSLVP